MWGNAAIAIAIDTGTGGPADGHEPYLQLENYGAFASLLKDGDKRGGLGEPAAHHRRGGGARTVALGRRAPGDIGPLPDPDRSMDAAIEDTFRALREVEATQERGEEPQGSERSANVYEVNGEEAVPLPEGWFEGLRDERYGYSEGGYRRLWPEPTQPTE
jgi:hypothetical protein